MAMIFTAYALHAVLVLLLAGATRSVVATDAVMLPPLLSLCAVEAASNVSGPPAFLQCRLQYYVQVLVGDITLNQHLLPPLNASFSGPFGAGELFAFNITQAPDRASRKLGSARGFTINSAYSVSNPVDLIEVELISYNDGVHNGTIQLQGEILSLPTNELAIVGGTGSFRGARGFGFVSRVLSNGSYNLFHHDLHFL